MAVMWKKPGGVRGRHAQIASVMPPLAAVVSRGAFDARPSYAIRISGFVVSSSVCDDSHNSRSPAPQCPFWLMS